MKSTLCIKLDATTKQRLAAYLEAEEWLIGELQAGIAELEEGRGVDHERGATWPTSWGKAGESKAPG